MTLQADGSSNECSQSLGCLVPQQMAWMTSCDMMAANYIPLDIERKEHTALMLTCMQAVGFLATLFMCDTQLPKPGHWTCCTYHMYAVLTECMRTSSLPPQLFALPAQALAWQTIMPWREAQQPEAQ